MKGRKPKPSYLRLLDGNAGHRPLNPDEPIPTGEIGDPPPWMTGDQKRLWHTAVRQAPEGLLKNVDASCLTGWVCACDMHRLASQKIAQFGALVKHPVTGLPIKSPYLQIQDQQHMLMTRSAAEMGFTPSSRSRVRVTKGRGKGGIFDELKEIE
jgi:P27 family predicted phage terminase small subunit